MVGRGRQAAAGAAWPLKKLFFGRLCGIAREGRTPQLETAIEAVHITEALADQVGRCTLAGVAVITGNNQRRIEIRLGDKGMQRVVIEVL